MLYGSDGMTQMYTTPENPIFLFAAGALKRILVWASWHSVWAWG